MLVAVLLLSSAGGTTPPTGEQVCAAGEGDGLLLLQSGPPVLRTPPDALRPLRSGVLSLLQTSGPEAHPQETVESPDSTFETDNQQAPRDHGAVTIVMPQRMSRAPGIALATSNESVTESDAGENRGSVGSGRAGDETGEGRDDHEDHADSNNKDGMSNDNLEDHEDTGNAASDASDQVSGAEPPKKPHTPEIFDIPSEECQKPCVNGICHDGECFCRYPYVGLQCEIVAIAEIGKVLALTMLTSLALFTALCVAVVIRANQKTSAAAPVQEPHMADEEWLPPTDSS